MTFLITIYDDFSDKEMSGEFTGITPDEAIDEAKDFYSYALDTFPEDIQIINVIEK